MFPEREGAKTWPVPFSFPKTVVILTMKSKENVFFGYSSLL
jgi:hypothetical protein